MLKKQELSDPSSCMSKAHDTEMVFVLLARDPCAPEAIRYWTYLRAGGKPLDFVIPQARLTLKLQSALGCADEMDRTREQFRVPA